MMAHAALGDGQASRERNQRADRQGGYEGHDMLDLR